MQRISVVCVTMLVYLTLGEATVIEGLDDTELAMIGHSDGYGSCDSYCKLDSATSAGISITLNGLPDHDFSCVNPNSPAESWVTYVLPRTPSFAPEGPYSLPPGPIGIAINGVAFFNPLTAESMNAVDGTTAELFDCCYGHSTQDGTYHYHKQPCSAACNNPVCEAGVEDPQFIGIAFDGFPIYAWQGVNVANLDECHGTTLPDGRYAYISVKDHFPYIMGCYKGEPEIIRDKAVCSGPAVGKLCDSRAGAVSESDVTTTARGLGVTSDHGEQEFLEELRKYLRADSRRTKRDTPARCYESTCAQAAGYSYSSTEGTCSRQSGGGAGDGTGGAPGGGEGGAPPPGGDGHRPPPKKSRPPKRGRALKPIVA